MPDASRPPARLKRRADFLAAARGVRVHDAAFTLQAGRRPLPAPEVEPPAPDPRIGFTVTKKTGNAPERNRIRRRLREALRHAKALSTEAETDYVVVARRDLLATPFPRLIADLQAAMRRAGGKLRKARVPGAAPRRPA